MSLSESPNVLGRDGRVFGVWLLPDNSPRYARQKSSSFPTGDLSLACLHRATLQVCSPATAVQRTLIGEYMPVTEATRCLHGESVDYHFFAYPTGPALVLDLVDKVDLPVFSSTSGVPLRTSVA